MKKKLQMRSKLDANKKKKNRKTAKKTPMKLRFLRPEEYEWAKEGWARNIVNWFDCSLEEARAVVEETPSLIKFLQVEDKDA